MKYFGGCDVGSTYTKAVILDENGKMCADTTIRSKINAGRSAIAAMQEVCDKVGLKDSKELSTPHRHRLRPQQGPGLPADISRSPATPWAYTSRTRKSAPSSISGGQDVKEASAHRHRRHGPGFAMNDKCSAGTGRFFGGHGPLLRDEPAEFSNLS